MYDADLPNLLTLVVVFVHEVQLTHRPAFLNRLSGIMSSVVEKQTFLSPYWLPDIPQLVFAADREIDTAKE
jgi:hypothetical protein